VVSLQRNWWSQCGGIRKLVKDRNDTAHPNGNIFFSTQDALDDKIIEILRIVDEIQTHSKPVIEHTYENFLIENYDSEEREYIEASDQVREVLIHGNYMSTKDIEICAGFNLDRMAGHSQIDQIRDLHTALLTEYGTED